MSDLLHPLPIGSVTLPNNIVLSPMAGFSDLPFRVLCRRHGAGLVCCEMVSAPSVERQVDGAIMRLRTVEEERPVSIQLFGTDPEEIARAAKRVEEGCDILGFNMGCPAHQIKRQGCGAALLDHPDLAMDIVRAIKSASRKPLIVKMRAGNATRMDVVAFARRLEAAGADALLFHARTAKQAYSGRADWGLIREVVDAVGIPVVGNGDVVDGPSAERALRESGAAGVALGRGTLGDPRVFGRILHYFATGEVLPPPTPRDRLADFEEYLDLCESLGYGDCHAITQAQQFAKGVPGAARLRTALQIDGTMEDLRRIFREHLSRRPAAVVG